MTLPSFKDWLRESSAHTRRRRAVALGLMPLAGLGSTHGRSTALPWEVESIEKQDKKSKRKKKKKKKMLEAKREVAKNPQVDKWLDKVRQLKGSLDDLDSEKEKAEREKKVKSDKDDKPKDKDKC